MREYLIAVYLVSGDNYSGQADQWYARLCMAGELLRRWFQIRDPYDWMKASSIKEECKQRVRAFYAQIEAKYL